MPGRGAGADEEINSGWIPTSRYGNNSFKWPASSKWLASTGARVNFETPKGCLSADRVADGSGPRMVLMTLDATTV